MTTCDGCIVLTTVYAALPTAAQAAPDPSTPLSLYLNQDPDPDTLQALLTAGPDGPSITPLTFHWDDFHQYGSQKPSPHHLIVEHPLLPPSPRPYVFRILQLNQVGIPYYHLRYNSILPETGMKFTIGPALAGDLNDDGNVTLADVLLAVHGVLSPETLTPAQTFAADLLPRDGANGHVIGDGAVTIGDVVYLLRRVVGLIPDVQWP